MTDSGKRRASHASGFPQGITAAKTRYKNTRENTEKNLETHKFCVKEMLHRTGYSRRGKAEKEVRVSLQKLLTLQRQEKSYELGELPKLKDVRVADQVLMCSDGNE